MVFAFLFPAPLLVPLPIPLLFPFVFSSLFPASLHHPIVQVHLLCTKSSSSDMVVSWQVWKICSEIANCRDGLGNSRELVCRHTGIHPTPAMMDQYAPQLDSPSPDADADADAVDTALIFMKHATCEHENFARVLEDESFPVKDGDLPDDDDYYFDECYTTDGGKKKLLRCKVKIEISSISPAAFTNWAAMELIADNHNIRNRDKFVLLGATDVTIGRNYALNASIDSFSIDQDNLDEDGSEFIGHANIKAVVDVEAALTPEGKGKKKIRRRKKFDVRAARVALACAIRSGRGKVLHKDNEDHKGQVNFT